jgi:hypothetical protein
MQNRKWEIFCVTYTYIFRLHAFLKFPHFSKDIGQLFVATDTRISLGVRITPARNRLCIMTRRLPPRVQRQAPLDSEMLPCHNKKKPVTRTNKIENGSLHPGLFSDGHAVYSTGATLLAHGHSLCIYYRMLFSLFREFCFMSWNNSFRTQFTGVFII